MKRDYTKRYDDNFLSENYPVKVRGNSGKYHNARPEPYYGFFYRIHDAWNVLWLKADALYWTIDEDN